MLCQCIKVADFFRYITSNNDSISLCAKWLVVDTLLILALGFLRIPRLNYSNSTIALQIVAFAVFNCLLFGGITLNGPTFFGQSSASRNDAPIATSSGFSLLSLVAPLTFGLLPDSWLAQDGHLVGQHTVRMSPISTAKINPEHENFCLAPDTKYAWIPVLLNNTELSSLRYTHLPLVASPDAPVKAERYELSARELKAIKLQHEELSKSLVLATQPEEEDEYDEYDDDEKDHNHSNLQKSQQMVYLRISKPGIIKLEQVNGASNTQARLLPREVVVVPCPTVSFPKPPKHQTEDVLCSSQDNARELTINVYGVPPLSLRWAKYVNGHKEQFLVEGIEGEKARTHRVSEDASTSIAHQSQVVEPGRVQIPLTVNLNDPGAYVYTLEEVVDGIGNLVKIPHDSMARFHTATTQTFFVLTRPSISFAHCSLENPKALLVGSEASMSIRAMEADHRDGPWDIALSYQPAEGTASKKDQPWTKVVKAEGPKPDVSVAASTPGQYTITGIKGKYCTGTVFAPSDCKVVERPLPSAEIEWKRIHECSGDTGVSANMILRGTPPFQVYYRVQRDNEAPREYSKTFSGSRGELTLQPERSGHYVFTFISLSDVYYKKTELKGPSIEQIVHPLASADFADSHVAGKSKRAISSCSGDNVDIAVDLKGTGPWNLDVQVIGPSSVETISFEDIKGSRKTLQIPIPAAIMADGGRFEVALVSVEDVYKCKRSLSVPGLMVNVKRSRPTARFYGTEQERRVSITENDEAKLPLRLTGSGPWTVRYRRSDLPERTLTARLSNPNDQLVVRESGLYEIVSVADSQCPGTVAPEASTYIVTWIARPTAKLSLETPAGYIAHNNSHILSTICEGVSDHVDLELTGRPPFQIMYNIAQGNVQGGTRLIDNPTINSIQPRTRFQLLTSTPGRMYYEVKQIGDSVYPLEKSVGTVIPRSQRLLFEQEVAMRPSAYFKNRNRMTYCLHTEFTPQDASSSDGVVVLEGRPPFILNLSIKNVGAAQVENLLVNVPTNVWKIDLPNYTFASVGPHRVTIDSVTDSSNCAQSVLDPLLSSIWVDVAEVATIEPFEKRWDVCVGEVTQFQLEGIPPWTVGYRVNSKSYTKEVKTSPFSLVQQKPGEVTITSIAHQQQMCKVGVPNLHFNVHQLPSAKVGAGKNYYEDIHEGDQAEIVFTLIGEPPFTFTYQRAEPSARKNGKPGRVLETHTVSRVMSHEYSIFSALEGTWTVTSISDKYCRYPPVQQELDSNKQRP